MARRGWMWAAAAAATITVVLGGTGVDAADSPPPPREPDEARVLASVEKLERRVMTVEEALAAMSKRLGALESDAANPQPPMRAIVAARLEDDKPIGNGVWRGRLIPPASEIKGDYVRHVDPGAKLVLVNLCDEPVTFSFHPSVIVEGHQFTVPADGVQIVTVQKAVSAGPGSTEADFTVVSASAFSGLPGPRVLIP